MEQNAARSSKPDSFEAAAVRSSIEGAAVRSSIEGDAVRSSIEDAVRSSTDGPTTFCGQSPTSKQDSFEGTRSSEGVDAMDRSTEQGASSPEGSDAMDRSSDLELATFRPFEYYMFGDRSNITPDVELAFHMQEYSVDDCLMRLVVESIRNHPNEELTFHNIMRNYVMDTGPDLFQIIRIYLATHASERLSVIEKQVDGIDVISVTEDVLEKETKCAICLEDFKMEEQLKLLNCSHFFHRQCLSELLKSQITCPLCKQLI